MARPITADDLWNLRRVGQPDHVPGTTSVVVPVAAYPDDEPPSSVLYLVERNGTTRQLTSCDRHASVPAPDPEGTRVAFLGKRGDEKAQVHVISLSGGEARKVSDLPLGAKYVTWVPGRDSLIVVAPLLRDFPSIGATDDEIQDRGDTTRPLITEDRVYRHWKRWLAGDTIDHLFRIDLDNETTHHLTPGLDRLIGLDDLSSSLAVTPDGHTIVFTLDDFDEPWEQIRFRLHTVPVDGGAIARMPTADTAQQIRPRLSPDGATLVYGVQYEENYYADLVRVVSHHMATGVEHVITADWDRSASGWEFIGNDELVFHAEDEGKVRIFTLTIDDGTPIPQTSTGSNHGARVGLDCLWHRTESMHLPPEVAVTCGGRTTRVSTFNADLLAELELRPAEEIRFEGAAGDQIQTYVVEPPGFDASATRPLLHNVHGGPHNGVMDAWHWRWNTQVMAAAGYVVVSVNFHGSSSFGDAFTRSIRGAWGDMPARDIEAATDHLIDLEYADPDRLAIAGGSYGGYLVSWLTTRSERYVAAICHAGVTDLVGQWASDHTAGRDQAIGGVPWQDMDAVTRWSPIANTHDMVTPTLVIHGELDYRVVVTQGLVLYGLLKAKGVPSRLVYFSKEGHWIEERSNAIVWWREFLTWLERWL
jgi:dipeptidyl aminopeptidase/acylaminoacyl peptidase